MHTPGPWTAAPQDGVPGNCFTAQVFGPDDKEVAEITSRDDAQEATDNARAIAAIPEFMVAAAMMTAAEDSGGDMWWNGFEMLKAAYKKAGGLFPSMDAVRQPDICPGDQKHCKTEGDEAHFRCGTVQCGQKSLHQF